MLDFLYLSFLAIAGSGLVTLLLFGLYRWYDTGMLPLLNGLPASLIGGEGARFWIGSIYVPLFLGFVGIAIAHRLLNLPDSARLSSSLSPGRITEMADESDSIVLESIADILSGSDAADAQYKGMFRGGPALAGCGDEQWQSRPVGHYATFHASTDDNYPGCTTMATINMIRDAIAKGKAAAQTEPADNDTNVQAAGPVSVVVPAGGAVAATQAHDHGTMPDTPAAPAKAEPAESKKKESSGEPDFIEQLKDPVNREKLVALLMGVE